MTAGSATENKLNHAKDSVSSARSTLQNLKRKWRLQGELTRDTNLHTVLSSNPNCFFSSLKANKKASVKINKLNVGNKIFTGENVGKGFF